MRPACTGAAVAGIQVYRRQHANQAKQYSERRFLEGEEEDATDLIEYAYAHVLDETEMPQRRWSDDCEDYSIEG